MLFNKVLIASAVLIILLFQAVLHAEDGFTPLFDGKSLEGWVSAHSKGDGDWGPFSVNEKEQAIHVYADLEDGSEQSTDCLNTVAQYSHYILKLEYMWPGKRFAPRSDWDRDAGLLYHVHGDLTMVWPLSMEMQIGETPGDYEGKRRYHTGDLFVLGKNLRAKVARTKRYYDPAEEPVVGRHVRTKLGVERPMGEWNKIELHVHGSEKATFIFNGETVLELTDMVQIIEGKHLPLEKGHIGLQAEWAEIMYRNIRIKELPNK